jgi:hypothetical protein
MRRWGVRERIFLPSNEKKKKKKKKKKKHDFNF